jgi:hypothetical protein
MKQIIIAAIILLLISCKKETICEQVLKVEQAPPPYKRGVWQIITTKDTIYSENYIKEGTLICK